MVAHAKDLPHVSASSFEGGALSAAKGWETNPVGTAPRTGGAANSHAAAAVVAVRETVEAAEHVREANRSSVDLTLDAPNNERLHVHLRWQDGVIHTRFVTESTELRQALAREWEQAAPRMAERQVKFGEPSFERHDQPGQSGGQGGFSFEQQRQSSRGREHTAGFGAELGFALGQARGSALQPARPAPSTGALRAVGERTTEQTNLSTWA